MKNNKTAIIVIICAALVILALLCCAGSGIGYMLWKESKKTNGTEETEEQENESYENDEDDEDDQDDEDEDEDEETQVTSGYITGQVGYPSEYIPDQKVCAYNISTGYTYCQNKVFAGSDYSNNTYTMELDEGSYQVYAMLLEPIEGGADITTDYKAYYSEFVTCGMSVGCDSHLPITVVVVAEMTTENVDPTDWYDFDQMF
jgi:hypothetical protein